MVPLQKRYFAINCPKNVSAIVIREHEVFAHRQNTSRSMFSLTPRRYSPTSLFKGFSCLCRGRPVCPPVSMISFDFGKTTAKMTFSRIFLEKSYPVASPGAHAGAPLQKLLKRFATDVGENLCVLPVKINVLIFFGYDSKNHVFSVQSLNKFVLDFKSKRWDKMKKVVVLLALLLITLSVLGISLPKEHVAYDPYGNRIYQVDTGEIKTGFTIIGEGEPLLLLMGLGGTIMDWP